MFEWRSVTFFLYYVLLLVSLVLSCLTDQLPLFSRAVSTLVSLLLLLRRLQTLNMVIIASDGQEFFKSDHRHQDHGGSFNRAGLLTLVE